MSGAGEGAVVASVGAGASTRRPQRAGRAGLLVLLALAVAVQVVVLYAPEGGGAPLFPNVDKVVHVVVFLVPVALALLAGFRRRTVVLVFAAQAVVSELVQALLLPHRTGDVLDVVADLTGVALGVLVAHACCVVARAGGRRAETRVAASVRGLGDAVPLVDWVVHRGARTHGRVRRNRRVRPRPIPPGAPVTPRSNRPPRTTVS